eukprot:COSAG01_NODE_507_length_16108_cov_18.603973_9_plen_86_part_00
MTPAGRPRAAPGRDDAACWLLWQAGTLTLAFRRSELLRPRRRTKKLNQSIPPAHQPEPIQCLDDSAVAPCCRLQARRKSRHLSTF